ncbi:AraC family transcriptional regulator [Pseudorhodoplanes sp.]|uniref:AraC family transcriptional regulator n=1 Tax=Pseudorhodoplanes sp. TaxID=1934341 RepID=UPI003918A0AA
MDALSDVLRSVRLTGGVFLDSRFTAPWCVTATLTGADIRPFLAAMPRQLICYHVVINGRAILSISGEPSIEVCAGEVLLLPGNDGHVLASEHGLEPVPAGSLITMPPNGGLPSIEYGGGGNETQIVCGFLASEDGYNPLIAALPRTLKLDLREGTSREWIESSVRFAAAELASGRLSSSEVMSRLSETLLVEAVRKYTSTLPENESGWLNGLRDPHVGRALTLIHGNIGKDWSVEDLAREVALSRSAFVDRFTSLVGMPPIRYLTVWRMRTARLNLREKRMSIAQLAHAVGYQSEEAFSRAFKREYGVSPAHWRDSQAAG